MWTPNSHRRARTHKHAHTSHASNDDSTQRIEEIPCCEWRFRVIISNTALNRKCVPTDKNVRREKVEIKCEHQKARSTFFVHHKRNVTFPIPHHPGQISLSHTHTHYAMAWYIGRSSTKTEVSTIAFAQHQHNEWLRDDQKYILFSSSSPPPPLSPSLSLLLARSTHTHTRIRHHSRWCTSHLAVFAIHARFTVICTMFK